MSTTDRALDSLLSSIDRDFAQKIAEMKATRNDATRFRIGADFLRDFYGIRDDFFDAMQPQR